MPRLLLMMLALPAALLAQPAGQAGQAVDKILAVVDDELILQSEVEYQYLYLKQSGQKDDGTLFCQVLEGLLTDRLLLAKARIDSLVVNEDQVTQELDRRLNAMARQYGGEDVLEREVKKSIIELKVELRPRIEEQLLIEQMKASIFENVNVSPKDVRDFYKTIPADSLPNLPAEVEISQIILKPSPSLASRDAAREKLAGILADIKAGKTSFEDAAKNHSEDPGSRKNGGMLGVVTRKDVVPEFAAALYVLRPGEVSGVFESPFGFHIARLHARNGEDMTVSHILIRPKVTPEDEKRCRARLEEIRAKIVAGTLTFAQAAHDHSEDPRTKDNGGRMTDPVTGSNRIPLGQLEGDLYFKVDALKPGQLSEVTEIIFQDVQLTKAYQLLLLHKRHSPHVANLEADFEKFKDVTRQARQAEALQTWFEGAKKQVYIEIRDPRCEQALQNWYR